MSLEPFRWVARRARHLPERLLHGWRHRAARRQLTRRPAPRNVLFLCHGNICRSPYAAAVARRLFSGRVKIESAGFFGPDRPSPSEAVAVAAERGVDLGQHRSSLVTPERLRSADVVLVMDRTQYLAATAARIQTGGPVVILGDLDPEPFSRRAIADPVNQPAGAFRSSYDRIDRCVRTLARFWN